jgi:hypothetical protein
VKGLIRVFIIFYIQDCTVESNIAFPQDSKITVLISFNFFQGFNKFPVFRFLPKCLKFNTL